MCGQHDYFVYAPGVYSSQDAYHGRLRLRIYGVFYLGYHQQFQPVFFGRHIRIDYNVGDANLPFLFHPAAREVPFYYDRFPGQHTAV